MTIVKKCSKINYMKIKKLLTITIAGIFFALPLSLSGCVPQGSVTLPSLGGVPSRYTREEDKLAVFKTDADGMRVSNGYRNNPPFNCLWSYDALSYEGGCLSMSVRKKEDGFLGSEIRTREYYSYGYYSVCMKAAKASGVISSFFTYTNRPWDEIDIEFLGKDTTKVQFNYFRKGVGGREYVYKLGFDASEDFHEYGFDWRKDSITWYVDGKAVYRATKNIPVTDTQIMANVWNGVGSSFDAWCGRLDEDALPATAQYKWIAYSKN